mmetsp:Transcript_26100/g.66269  ORF Transcript_26100/g.66269 Transcript_26100/m.66269 type:complete len:211 (-) Transcript_26100:441-1073(-)
MTMAFPAPAAAPPTTRLAWRPAAMRARTCRESGPCGRRSRTMRWQPSGWHLPLGSQGLSRCSALRSQGAPRSGRYPSKPSCSTSTSTRAWAYARPPLLCSPPHSAAPARSGPVSSRAFWAQTHCAATSKRRCCPAATRASTAGWRVSGRQAQRPRSRSSWPSRLRAARTWGHSCSSAPPFSPWAVLTSPWRRAGTRAPWVSTASWRRGCG